MNIKQFIQNNQANPTRFLAEPRKVRVSVRKSGGRFLVTVTSLVVENAIRSEPQTNPVDAVEQVLRAAEDMGMDGVNTGVEGTA